MSGETEERVSGERAGECEWRGGECEWRGESVSGERECKRERKGV